MIFILTAAIIGLWLVGPWLLMLLLGALASILAVPALAIGFWACFLICVVLSLIGSYLNQS